MKRQELLVAALRNGTVIDHIPSSKLFGVINLLHLEQMSSAITIGYNLKSEKMGEKSIIKIADKFFSDEVLNKLAIISPHVSLSIIKDYEVVEKKEVKLPECLNDVVKCTNPKCITNNEPMATYFTTSRKDHGMIRCRYCEKEQSIEHVKIIGQTP